MNSMVRMMCGCVLVVAMFSMLPVFAKQAATVVNELSGAPTSTSQAAPPPSAPPPAPESRPTLAPDDLSPPGGDQSPTGWTVLAIIGAVCGCVLVVIVVGFFLWRSVSRHRGALREARERRAAQLQRWSKGVKAVESVSEMLWEFESDPESVYFTRPLLADVTEPDSATFYAAYAKVQALHTETVPLDDEQIAAFVTAAGEAQRAFGVADENAWRKARLGVVSDGRILTIEEKRKLGQARKLMAQALDSANTAEAAASAHAKATALLDEVGVVVPERLATVVVRQIEATHRAELTAGKAAS